MGESDRSAALFWW